MTTTEEFRTELKSVLTGLLTDLANAREYEAAYPSYPAPKPRVSCPACGSDNAHRLWINFTDRCTFNWHNDK